MHFVSGMCEGEWCYCGKPATHKVGEEIPYDDPLPHRHNLTQYVCCQCFVNIVGNAAPCNLTRYSRLHLDAAIEKATAEVESTVEDELDSLCQLAGRQEVGELGYKAAIASVRKHLQEG